MNDTWKTMAAGGCWCSCTRWAPTIVINITPKQKPLGKNYQTLVLNGFNHGYFTKHHWNVILQGGTLLAISRVITRVTYLFSAIYRGYKSTYNDRRGQPCTIHVQSINWSSDLMKMVGKSNKTHYVLIFPLQLKFEIVESKRSSQTNPNI